jgi:hypothetical protein
LTKEIITPTFPAMFTENRHGRSHGDSGGDGRVHGGADLSIRPLPFEEWARGAAVVSIQSLVAT